MNPWDWAIFLLGWTALAIIALVSAFIVVLIIRSMWQHLAAAFGKGQQMPLEDYLQEAAATGTTIYDDEIFMKAEQVDAFLQGARWGWGWHRR